MADLKQLQTALELYYTDQNAYPAGNGISLGEAAAACLNNTGFMVTNGCTSPYMGQVPLDPQFVAKAWKYIYTLNGNTYSVTAQLEGDVNGLNGNIILSPAGIAKQ